jgi:hypothetical protein
MPRYIKFTLNVCHKPSEILEEVNLDVHVLECDCDYFALEKRPDLAHKHSDKIDYRHASMSSAV